MHRKADVIEHHTSPESLSRHRTNAAGPLMFDPVLDLVPEMADQALDRPRGRITQCTNRVAFDLFGNVEQHVNFLNLGLALHQTIHDAHHPACAFAAWRALTTAFVLVERA